MQQGLSSPIEYLKGVGPQRATLLNKELGIFTFRDLLYHFPFRYIDRSRFHKISEISDELTYVQLKGTISNIATTGTGRSSRLTALLQDESGTIELIWFKGIKWIQQSLRSGTEYIAFGRPSRYKDRFNLAHPELDPVAKIPANRSALQPVYHTTEKLSSRGLNSRGIGKLVEALLPQVRNTLPETLSTRIVEWLGGLSREQAIIELHAPTSEKSLRMARQRSKFEELFYVQLNLLMQKLIAQHKVKGIQFDHSNDRLRTSLIKSLPFTLTGAQQKVLSEIEDDLGSGRQMNRLLQGDVGSGKTIVALASMLMALDNNKQACMMAPTEILARQHFESIGKLLDGSGIEIDLLTGSTKAAARKKIQENLQNGNLNILIGTHALIEDTVQFNDLALVVIDEQHRFGVAQRARLWKKNDQPPHVLVMTATPIPRTLAMTLYGDLDVSVINELPPGRKPIKTVHRSDKKRLEMYAFLEDQIKAGRQIYIVFPLIKESEKMDLKDLKDGFETISRQFPTPEYQVSIVHGQLKSEIKEHEMDRFVRGETDIMVATTVIEVGVDVPNASVMVIESAERFGLSQLHQLRGRVGRGAEQSYCILMSGYKLTNEARKRLETMVQTNDGFKIAEVDMELRGPGNMMGTQQSGIMDLKHADLATDQKLLKKARDTAIRLLEIDPKLTQAENAPIAKKLSAIMASQRQWSRIS